MISNQIHDLLHYSDHPVVERYLMGFVGYPGNLESATRDDLLQSTMTQNIHSNIRLYQLGVVFFDREGQQIETPDTWKAQELLGFESTYRATTLTQILQDIRIHDANPTDWPESTIRCTDCRHAGIKASGICRQCLAPNW